MEPDWADVKEVYGEALERDSQARTAYLDEACSGQPRLRAEVDRLLRENDDDDGPLSEPSIWKPAEVFAPGEVIQDRFVVVRLIGRGGIGEVYEVQDRLMERRLAMKTLQSSVLSKADARGRFKREILMGQKVSHRNCCRIYDAILTKTGWGEAVSFTMELLEGETLAQRLSRDGHLREGEAWALALPMAQGLAAVHEAGLVHRDFKPANVVLSRDDSGQQRVVVTDFGLTRPGSKEQAEVFWRSQTGQILGTESYMAPEQREARDLTPAADVYALGLVLVEMLQGAGPAKAGHVRPTALRGHWTELINRCLQRDPAERPQSAAEVAATLRGFVRMPPPKRDS